MECRSLSLGTLYRAELHLTLVGVEAVRPWVPLAHRLGASLGFPEASGSPRGVPGTAPDVRVGRHGSRPDLVVKVVRWRPGTGRALGSAMTYQM